jgi:LPXTG-motif cell wall-anchored protein
LIGEEAPGALPLDPNAVIKFADVAPGTYTITELPVPGYASKPIACDGRFDANTVVFGQNSVTVTLGPGEFATCDFVNTQHQVEIIKDAAPADGTDFNFTGTFGGFVLDDAQPDDGDAFGTSRVFSAPFDTAMTITEGLPTGWQLDGITCDPGPIRDPNQQDDTTIGIDLATRTVTVKIGDLYARTISCTFTNSLLPVPTSTTTTTTTTTTAIAPTSTAAPAPTTSLVSVLPATGSSSMNIAIAAAAIIGFGALIIASARRRPI